MKSILYFVALCAVISGCSAPRLSVIPRFGQLDVSGDLGVNAAGSGFSAQNSVDDVGLQKDDSVPGGRVDLEFIGTHVTFELSDSSHGGEGTLAAQLSDGNTTIPAGTAVDTKFDLLLSEAVVTFDLIPGDMFELGIGLGATIAGVDAKFVSQSTGDTIKTDETLPIPVLAARAGVRFDRFDVSALLGGTDVRINGDHAQLFDLDAMARMRILGSGDHFNGGIVVGYRWIDAQLEYEDSDRDVDADLTFSGPYIGIDLTF